MNESNNNYNTAETKVKTKKAKEILEYISKNPKGVRFKDLKDSLKIPDSTLSRNIDLLMKEGSLVKAGNLYLPSGGDIALMLFRKAMDVIAESVKPIYLAEENEKQIQNDKNQDSEKAKENLKSLKAEIEKIKDGVNGKTEQLKIAVEEIEGGNIYQYHALPSDDDLLTLIRLLKYSTEGPMSGLGFEEWLSSFIVRAFRYRAEKRIEVKEAVVKVLREIEAHLFEKRTVFEAMGAGNMDTVWLNVYEALCLLNDKQIPTILNRIIGKVKGADEGKLNNIKRFLYNELRCDKLEDTLYNMQFELFQRQLDNSTNPYLSKFYGALRKMVMDSEGSTSERGDKDN